VSNKLKNVIREEVTRREMVQDGLVGIANGENPRLVGARLQSYLG
jgi:chemotaxis protein MotA